MDFSERLWITVSADANQTVFLFFFLSFLSEPDLGVSNN